MNEGRPLVAYSFAHVKRNLVTRDEVNANAALVSQRSAQLAFEKASGGRILQTIVDWRTYRGSFVSREKFRRALEVARSCGADLLLADIKELLARTPSDQIGKCADALNTVDVEVWDASLRRTWQSMTGPERQDVVITAAQTNKARSKAVKTGIRLSRTEKTTPLNANYKHGNRANRRSADERANRLRAFVQSEIANLPEGEALSPSALAAALNAAGVPSPRGGSWSHNTAKDLIARVRSLPGEPATT